MAEGGARVRTAQVDEGAKCGLASTWAAYVALDWVNGCSGYGDLWGQLILPQDVNLYSYAPSDSQAYSPVQFGTVNRLVRGGVRKVITIMRSPIHIV